MTQVDFVDTLSEDRGERRRLRALGAVTPSHLLALAEAAPAAFNDAFGPDRAAELVRRLRDVVPARPADDTDVLACPLGVPVHESSPAVLQARPETSARDAMFDRIETLKRSGAAEAEIRRAEADLDRFLDSSR